MRSVLSRALSNFRSASSQDVGGDEDNEEDDDAPVAQEAPAAVQGGAGEPKVKATGKIFAAYEPMRAWFGAPARGALRTQHGDFPSSPDALANWKAFGAVTTAFLDDQGAVPGPSTAPAKSSSRAKGRTTVAKRTSPAKAPVPAARAGKAGSNWFRNPAKKAAKKAAKASQRDLEAQTSAVPAPATQAKRAGGMSDWFSNRSGTTSDVEAARPSPAQDPTAGDVKLLEPVDESEAEAIVRSILDEVGADGQISVLAGWKALRTNAAFARAMGFCGQEGEWDRLVLAFGDKEGEVLSFEEFRNVALSAVEDGPTATAAGTQSSAMAKLRAAARATTAFSATADVPPPPPESSGGPPEDLPHPPPSPQSPYYDSNF
jgi:hypothetical protein